ncbi:MAG: NAD(P)H-hydrate dehydratase [Acidimicrobiia bacterium]|nr:NAD(P)H-hydrate dehydratase [Acidimicrobiia bacterium]
MKPVITPDESARLDAMATDSVDVLMDRAGYALSIAAARMGAGYGTTVVVLCGPGNNGGDGYVAARYLRKRGVDVRIKALVYPEGEDSPSRRAGAKAARAGVPIEVLGDPEPVDLIIDALFGAGFRGELDGQPAAWAEAGGQVLAVDVPSGLDAATGAVNGPVFDAERTVTFHALKVGHLLGSGPDVCGEIDVVDIGLSGEDPELLLYEEADAAVPQRPRTAHKWSSGSVLVVGGSPGIGGAAMLTAQAALNSGAGAVKLAVPGGLEGRYSRPGVMTLGIGAADRFEAAQAGSILEAAERFDVMALGPGLGPDQDKLVAAILEGLDGPLVLDADGLNALESPDQLASRSGTTVITPHAGEFERLTGSEASLKNAARLARETKAVVVLKGNPTLVLGQEKWVVTAGGPELATVGTGDVLTGSIAALWARGLEPEAAARAAAYWHGRAGAALAEQVNVTAEGLVEEIGRWTR